MSQQQKILEMIEKGQITAAEGMDLLEALKEATPAVDETTENTDLAVKQQYKYLRVKVTSDNKTVNVNVNIPLRLLTTLGTVAGRLTTMIPKDARKGMENSGIDLSDIDIAKIIEEIIDGTLDDPNIVDVEAWDEEHNAMIKVRIYVD